MQHRSPALHKTRTACTACACNLAPGYLGLILGAGLAQHAIQALGVQCGVFSRNLMMTRATAMSRQ